MKWVVRYLIERGTQSVLHTDFVKAYHEETGCCKMTLVKDLAALRLSGFVQTERIAVPYEFRGLTDGHNCMLYRVRPKVILTRAI